MQKSTRSNIRPYCFLPVPFLSRETCNRHYSLKLVSSALLWKDLKKGGIKTFWSFSYSFYFILDHIPIIYLSIYITCTFLNKILWSQRYIIKPKFSHILWFFCDTTRIDKKKGVPIYTWFPGPRGLKWCFSLGANSTDTNRLI